MELSVEGPTLTVTLAVAVAPLRSVTVALRVCRPTTRPGTVRVPPVPRNPLTLDVHRTRAPRSPSSGSLATAVSTTGQPERMAVPSAGAWMASVGAAFGGWATIVPVAAADSEGVTVRT